MFGSTSGESSPAARQWMSSDILGCFASCWCEACPNRLGTALAIIYVACRWVEAGLVFAWSDILECVGVLMNVVSCCLRLNVFECWLMLVVFECLWVQKRSHSDACQEIQRTQSVFTKVHQCAFGTRWKKCTRLQWFYVKEAMACRLCRSKRGKKGEPAICSHSNQPHQHLSGIAPCGAKTWRTSEAAAYPSQMARCCVETLCAWAQWLGEVPGCEDHWRSLRIRRKMKERRAALPLYNVVQLGFQHFPAGLVWGHFATTCNQCEGNIGGQRKRNLRAHAEPVDGAWCDGTWVYHVMCTYVYHWHPFASLRAFSNILYNLVHGASWRHECKIMSIPPRLDPPISLLCQEFVSLGSTVSDPSFEPQTLGPWSRSLLMMLQCLKGSLLIQLLRCTSMHHHWLRLWFVAETLAEMDMIQASHDGNWMKLMEHEPYWTMDGICNQTL